MSLSRKYKISRIMEITSGLPKKDIHSFLKTHSEVIKNIEQMSEDDYFAIVKLLPFEEIIDFLQAHTDSVRLLKNTDKIIGMINYIVDLACKEHLEHKCNIFINSYTTNPSPEFIEAALNPCNRILMDLLNIFDYNLSFACTIDQLLKLLKSPKTTKTLTGKTFIEKVDEIRIRNFNLTIAEFCHRAIKNSDDLTRVLPFLHEEDRIRFINKQDAYWLQVEKRIAFLGGCVRNEAHSNFFLKNADKNLKIKILEEAELLTRKPRS